MVPFDNAALCRAIAALGPGEYWEAGDGDVQICAYLDDADADDRFALAKIRRRSRPLTEEAGVHEPLVLDAGKGLMDPIHIRLFENNILGAEYNNDGPRATRLRSYLSGKLPDEYGKFTMQPIYDRDVVERLGRMQEINLLHFQVNRSALDLEVRERNFFRGLIAASEQTDMSVLEVVVRVAKGEQHPNTDAVRTEVQQLLNARSGVEKVQIRGRREDGRSEEIDLLKDRIVSKQRMVRLDATTRAISPESAYQAIGEAYNAVVEHIPEIEFADEE